MIRVPRLRRPESDSPLWQTCQQLTAGVAPVESPHGAQWTHIRRVTWARSPYRYLLTELAEEQADSRLRRARIAPLVFNLACLSAERRDTGLINSASYFIAKQGLRGALHSEVPHWERLTDEDKKEMQDNVDFSFQHGFFVPTAEDEFVVETALKIASLDGVEQVG